MHDWSMDTDDGNLPITPRTGVDQTIVAVIVVSRYQPAELILYPEDATGFDRLTTWITATEESFVSLEDMR